MGMTTEGTESEATIVPNCSQCFDHVELGKQSELPEALRYIRP